MCCMSEERRHFEIKNWNCAKSTYGNVRMKCTVLNDDVVF